MKTFLDLRYNGQGNTWVMTQRSQLPDSLPRSSPICLRLDIYYFAWGLDITFSICLTYTKVVSMNRSKLFKTFCHRTGSPQCLLLQSPWGVIIKVLCPSDFHSHRLFPEQSSSYSQFLNILLCGWWKLPGNFRHLCNLLILYFLISAGPLVSASAAGSLGSQMMSFFIMNGTKMWTLLKTMQGLHHTK